MLSRRKNIWINKTIGVFKIFAIEHNNIDPSVPCRHLTEILKNNKNPFITLADIQIIPVQIDMRALNF